MRRRLRQPATALSALWLAVLAVACVAPSLLTGQDAEAQNLSESLQKPTAQHWLGTDKLGHDLLAQLIYGTRSVILATLVAGAVAIAIGVPLGLVAGYARGWPEAAISRVADGLMALPVIIVLLAVAGIFGNNLTLAMAVLGVILAAGFIRLVRTSTQAIRSESFIDAARVQGVPPTRIVTRHVLPNILNPVIVQLTFGLGVGILAVAGLSFLGLGPAPPATTWGSMVFQATQNLSVSPWQLVPSGLAIMLTVLAFNFVGDAIIDRPRPPGRKRRVPTPSLVPAQPTREVSATNEAPATGLLVVEDLTVAFPSPAGTALVVLDAVSFTIGHGEAVALVGESGCGKTMTARSVIGMLPHGGEIVGGRIQFDGRDLTAASESQWANVRGREIAYVAQDPLVALDPCFSVGSLLVEAVRRHERTSRAEARLGRGHTVGARRDTGGGVRARPLRSPTLWRDGPARRNRTRADRLTQTSHRRRTHERARRDGPSRAA